MFAVLKFMRWNAVCILLLFSPYIKCDHLPEEHETEQKKPEPLRQNIFVNQRLFNGTVQKVVTNTLDIVQDNEKDDEDEQMLPEVSGNYLDATEDQIYNFRQSMQHFSQKDSMPTEDIQQQVVTQSEAGSRSLGGHILGSKFSTNMFIPPNVFGTGYVSQILKDTCKPAGFPYTCQLYSIYETSFKCAVDIPYCQRIPCSRSNLRLDINMQKCLSMPGCCFDQTLYNYRRYYGQTVLPQVPVCHYAIRNPFFQKVASKFVQKFGGWNPLLTTCLIDSYRKRIKRNEMECAALSALEFFGLKAKQAGWRGITPTECGLIGGCWRPFQGCHYPPKMDALQLRPANTNAFPLSHSPFDLYGQPMCLPLDPYAESKEFLTSYHQCLAAGCSLDPTITLSVVLFHLNNITSRLPHNLVRDFKNLIVQGDIRADNWKYQIEQTMKYGRKHLAKFPRRHTASPVHDPYGARTTQHAPPHAPNLSPDVMRLLQQFSGGVPGFGGPPLSGPSSFTGSAPRAFGHPPAVGHAPGPETYRLLNMVANHNVPYGTRGNQHLPPVGGGYGHHTGPMNNAAPYNHQTQATNHGSKSQSVNAYFMQMPHQASNANYTRHYPYNNNGGYSTHSTRINLNPMPCPYKRFRIPNFPPLEGKMDGCCDRNLCYLNKAFIYEQYSGAAPYFGSWSTWTACPPGCGDFQQKRIRVCIGPNRKACFGLLEETRKCVGLPYCVERYSNWSRWTECKDCDGFRSRSRKCVLGSTCRGPFRERKKCPCKAKKDNSTSTP